MKTDDMQIPSDQAGSVVSRLACLRETMGRYGVQACLIPSSDPHLSEYLPTHWQARAYFSGFDGSAGTLVVTADFAGLWTDSRYFEQAAQQLDGSGVALMKLQVAHAPEYTDWLKNNLDTGDTLAVSGDCLGVTSQRRMQAELASVGTQLRTDLDLPGEAWADRPALPCAPVQAHEVAHAVTPRADKLTRVRANMAHAGATHHLVSTLDDIAWLTNLRGEDVAFNPVFLAHLLIDADGGTLFVDERKLDDDLCTQLAADGIRVADYAAITDALATLPAGARVLYDPAGVVSAVIDALPASIDCIERPNPSTHMKALKSDGELGHIRETMRRDGVALVQGFHRLEQALARGEYRTELDVMRLLYEARAAQPGFVGESFATIAGYMANGALPHYTATPEQHSPVGVAGLLLVDSGGQYVCGTTDITRVWAFGETTQEQRYDYTLVLKGMIGLSRARFPVGTSGQQIDALARAPIWMGAADYGHGTGHGVGYFLNVHDGPQDIRAPRSGGHFSALEPGMVCSIEPGLYKPGRHGVRHENLVAVQEEAESEFGRFLSFETLTLCPIDTRAVEPQLLEAAEIAWLNAYHAHVERELAPLLEAQDSKWLHARCQPLVHENG